MAGGTSQYMQQRMLSWVFGGSPTKPTAWGVGLSLGVPTSIAGSEASVSGYARQTATWGAAGSPASSGTVANASAIVFNLLSRATYTGFQIWDGLGSSNSGNMLAWGTLSTAVVASSGDSVSFSIGALRITLA
jgi:hypothetical protein